MKALGKLSVVIPAYNEAGRIGPTLDLVRAWLSEHVPVYEIIVVDDGSTDETAEIAMGAGDNVRVVRNDGNRGKGYSVAHGVREACGDTILFSDADLSTPIAECARLSQALADADIAIGSRALEKSNVTKHQPLYRETMGRIFNGIVQVLAVRGIRDTQCGFKLFRGDVARKLFSQLTTDGFAFDVEVLMLARRDGYRIEEVPVTWINDERTRVHPVYDSLRMLRDVVRLRLRHL